MRSNNKLNPHLMLHMGIESGRHWCKASALTTAPSLLSIAFHTNMKVYTNMKVSFTLGDKAIHMATLSYGITFLSL